MTSIEKSPLWKQVAIGIGLGAVLGAAGAWREAWEQYIPLSEAQLPSTAAVGAGGGLSLVLILYALRGLRTRGRGGFYAAWAIAGCATGIVITTLEVLITGKLWSYVIGTGFLLGTGAGLSLALVTRQLQGHKW